MCFLENLGLETITKEDSGPVHWTMVSGIRCTPGEELRAITLLSHKELSLVSMRIMVELLFDLFVGHCLFHIRMK